MNRILSFFLISTFLISCSKAEKKEVQKKVEEKIITEFGYTLNNYNVKKSKVKNGDSFGSILERNNLYYPQIYNIVQKVKKVYDIRKINIGKPYTILSSKDSLNTPLVFIYQHNKIDYVVVSLTDSLWAEKKSKAVKIKEFEWQKEIYGYVSIPGAFSFNENKPKRLLALKAQNTNLKGIHESEALIYLKNFSNLTTFN